MEDALKLREREMPPCNLKAEARFQPRTSGFIIVINASSPLTNSSETQGHFIIVFLKIMSINQKLF